MFRRRSLPLGLAVVVAATLLLAPGTAHAKLCWADIDDPVDLPEITFPCPGPQDQPPLTASPLVVVDWLSTYGYDGADRYVWTALNLVDTRTKASDEDTPTACTVGWHLFDWIRVTRGGRVIFNNDDHPLPASETTNVHRMGSSHTYTVYKRVEAPDTCHYWPTVLADSGVLAPGQTGEVTGVSSLSPGEYVVLDRGAGHENYLAGFLFIEPTHAQQVCDVICQD